MDKNFFFDKELRQELDKTRSAHDKFDKENHELKKLFKQKIGSSDMEIIVQVVDECGYEDEKNIIKEIRTYVNTDNFDDTHVKAFKQIVESYSDEIRDAIMKQTKKK